MKARVGVRHLRADLARYIARAEAGETIIVTVDGRPAVRLVPLDGDDVNPLDQLAAAGRALPPAVGRSRAPRASTGVPGAERAPATVGADVVRLMIRIRG